MPNPAEDLNYNPLLQRFFLSPEEKLQKETGKKIVRAFYEQQTNANSSINSFRVRNLRWIELLLWAKGSQNIQEFLGYMNVEDANKSWLNIDTTQSRLAAQFVGTLVESMAKNKTYPCVSAIDDGSVLEKEQRMFDALYRMHDVETIGAIQQQAGIQLEPPNAYVPDDEQAARVYFELQDRLPKEIRFEKMLKSVMDSIRYETIAKRKTLYDNVVLNASFTKIERVAPGKYSVRKCVPTNMIYNFFINDSGETEITMIGEFYNLKVKDFRRKFGRSPENPDGITEEEVYNLAKLSTNKSKGIFNYNWDPNWNAYPFNYNYPYDDCSVLVMDTRINCGEDAYFVSKKDAFGREDIQAKKNVPYQQRKKDGTYIEQPKPEDVEIIKKTRQTWMRGVYVPYGDVMLYWGKPDLIISNYTDVYNPLCDYTAMIANNDGEYVPSLFERGMDNLREYQLTKLTRKKLIAQIKPSGIRIDVESARNIDLGNGNTIEWDEVLRIYNQTGVELWSSKGLDPLSREAPPLSNSIHDETIEKIIGLTNVLEGIRSELRELWGVPQYRDGSDVGDRTSGVLQEQQNTASYNVTDYVLNADNALWQETFYKLCLLHWNDVVKEEPESKDDMLNTRFQVSVKMRATDYEKQLLEQDIQRFSQMPDAYGNPALTPKDALFLRNIDDYKLAILYLDSVVKENRKKSQEDSQKLQAQNAQVQMQSNQQAAEQQAQADQQKQASEIKLKQFEYSQQKELALLNGALNIAAKGMGIPPEWQPVIQALVPNILLPLQQETKMAAQSIQQSEMQEQAEQEEQQDNPQEENQEQMEPQMQ